MRAQTILWLLLRSRKTDLLVSRANQETTMPDELAAEKGSWKRRRLNTFQLFGHTAKLTGAKLKRGTLTVDTRQRTCSVPA
jgi:hypothetical protein